jgi:hypothetical protein
MARSVAMACAIAAMLAFPGSAVADDPTGVLLQERGDQPTYPGPLPEFTDGGPCYRGMHQQAFPNSQGYRCVRDR